MFRRRRAEPVDDQAVDLPPADEAPPDPAGPPPPQGPWDVADAPERPDRLDLGALRLVLPPDTAVQFEVGPDGARPAVMIGAGVVHLSAFAAPRNSGLWDEARSSIAEAIRAQGGSVEEASGPFGPELRARVPDDRHELHPVRYVGVDGPRWLLRADFTDRAALEPAVAAPLEEVVREAVVVRGSEAMAPGDLLPVAVPRELLEAAGVPPEELPGFDPLTRGPEITEVR